MLNWNSCAARGSVRSLQGDQHGGADLHGQVQGQLHVWVAALAEEYLVDGEDHRQFTLSDLSLLDIFRSCLAHSAQRTGVRSAEVVLQQ